MAKRYQEEYLIKIGILKCVVEIVCLRDVVHKKLVEFFKMLKNQHPNMYSQYYSMFAENNDNFLLEIKDFLIIQNSLIDAFNLEDHEYVLIKKNLESVKCSLRPSESVKGNEAKRIARSSFDFLDVAGVNHCVELKE